MKDLTDGTEAEFHLKDFEKQCLNSVLMIDGTSLETALARNEEMFFEIAAKAPSVCVCRCSPK